MIGPTLLLKRGGTNRSLLSEVLIISALLEKAPTLHCDRINLDKVLYRVFQRRLRIASRVEGSDVSSSKSRNAGGASSRSTDCGPLPAINRRSRYFRRHTRRNCSSCFDRAVCRFPQSRPANRALNACKGVCDTLGDVDRIEGKALARGVIEVDDYFGDWRVRE